MGAQASSVLLVVALWGAVSHALLIGWLICYILTQVARSVVISRFRREPVPDALVPAWGRVLTGLTLISAMLWGSSGVLLFPAGSFEHQFLIALFLSGIAAAAAVVYSPITECYLPTVLLLILPLSLRCFWELDPIHTMMGIVMIVFTAVLTTTGRHVHNITIDSLQLRFDNDELISSLKEQKSRAEDLNRDLRAEIEERTRAEERLKLAQEELEQRVEERTAEIARTNEMLVQEISERKQIEQELRESELKYRELVQNAQSIIIRLDRQGTVTFFNEFAQSFFGHDGNGVSGTTPLTDMPTHADVFSSDMAHVLETLESNRTDSYATECRTELKDGSTAWIAWTHKAVRNDDGELTEILCVGHDITDRKTAEQALRKAHDGLERRVSERTSDLIRTNELLNSEVRERRKAEERIKASLREKEVLLQEIHHRVKNNLQIMSSLLRLQAGRVSDETLLAVLRDARNRVRSMALVHERLYRSENLAGIRPHEYFRSLVDDIFTSYGPRAAGISSRFDIQDVTFTIDAAVPLGFIVSELVSNCLKHAFPDCGSGEVLISLHSAEDDVFELTVGDNGKGIPEHVDIEQAESLGLRLVALLARQLRGCASIRRSDRSEVLVRFRLPEPFARSQ